MVGARQRSARCKRADGTPEQPDLASRSARAAQDAPPNNLPAADYLKEYSGFACVFRSQKIHGWIFCAEESVARNERRGNAPIYGILIR